MGHTAATHWAETRAAAQHGGCPVRKGRGRLGVALRLIAASHACAGATARAPTRYRALCPQTQVAVLVMVMVMVMVLVMVMVMVEEDK